MCDAIAVSRRRNKYDCTLNIKVAATLRAFRVAYLDVIDYVITRKLKQIESKHSNNGYATCNPRRAL